MKILAAILTVWGLAEITLLVLTRRAKLRYIENMKRLQIERAQQLTNADLRKAIDSLAARNVAPHGSGWMD